MEDIARHGEECLNYLEGVERAEFLRDRRLQLVVERLLQIIGEAANGLSEEAHQRIDYDWRAVRGLRNVLAHRYGAVEPERIWGVVRNRLPDLVAKVRRSLK